MLQDLQMILDMSQGIMPAVLLALGTSSAQSTMLCALLGRTSLALLALIGQLSLCWLLHTLLLHRADAALNWQSCFLKGLACYNRQI